VPRITVLEQPHSRRFQILKPALEKSKGYCCLSLSIEAVPKLQLLEQLP
jgi:hypothetical protein